MYDSIIGKLQNEKVSNNIVNNTLQIDSQPVDVLLDEPLSVSAPPKKTTSKIDKFMKFNAGLDAATTKIKSKKTIRKRDIKELW